MLSFSRSIGKFSCSIGLRRNSSASVRDVYKLTGYKAPFKTEELSRILSVINQSPPTAESLGHFVPKSVVNKLCEHINACGPLDAVEQLLDVKGIEPKRLERICKAILKGQREASPGAGKAKKQDISAPHQLLKWISPVFTPQSYGPETVIVGCKMSLHHLSVAVVKGNRLLEWVRIAPSKNASADKDFFEQHVLLATTKEIVSNIPQGDVYVFEVQNRIFLNDQLMDIKYKSQILQTSVVTLMNALNPDIPIYSMKQNFVNRLYGTRVGSERTLTQQKIKELVLPFGLEVQEHQWESVLTHPKINEKEQMCEALLVSLGLSHLLSSKI